MFVSTYIPLLGGSLLAFERRSMPPTGDSWNPSPVQYVKLWQQELFTRASLSSPVSALAVGSAVAQAYILIQASGQYVVAVDDSAAKTGFKELWKKDLQLLCQQQQPEQGVCEINVDTSSPTVSPDGGIVYVCTGTTVKGACFALATATGERKWIYRVSNNGYTSSPALSLSGTLLYVPAYQGMNLHVVDAASCSTRSCSALDRSPMEHYSSSTPAG
jgi:outer membrane protein assembly factor BamB